MVKKENTKSTGLSKKIDKVISSKLSYKTARTPRATVIVDTSNPYTDDRSRFFKESYEAEKRRLFFK